MTKRSDDSDVRVCRRPVVWDVWLDDHIVGHVWRSRDNEIEYHPVFHAPSAERERELPEHRTLKDAVDAVLQAHRCFWSLSPLVTDLRRL